MIKKSSCKIVIFYLLVFCYNLGLVAQYPRLPKTTYQALNNYMNYSNEVVHATNLMYYDFLYLNEQFFNYVENAKAPIAYTKDDILTNYDYFPVFPRDLYLKILEENTNIPYDKRGAPLQLVGKVANVLKEIEDTRILLAQYIRTNDYQKDTNLVQGFKWLRRVEVLYYDMFTLQEKLHWSLTTIIQTYTQPPIDLDALRAVQELQPLLKQVKLVVKSVRAGDGSSTLSYNCLKLAEFMRQIESRKDAILEGLVRTPGELKSPDKRFDAMLQRSQNILKASQEYKDNPIYQNMDFKPNYYYYNINLLDNYNRAGDGIATLFNKFINHYGVYWLFEHEMPHIFQVFYPDVPEFEQYKDPEFDIEKIIQEGLLAKAKADSIAKAKADSLAQIIKDSIIIAQRISDSIEYRKNNPEVGDMNLNSFASNNLVFLLDVSASMSDTNKLPLLQSALHQLLDLMRPEDNITFITYSSKANLILPPTSAQYKDSILTAVKNLKSGGLSDANKGLKLAYKTIEEHILKDGNNRIILATDGAIKVSDPIKRLIRKQAKANKDKIHLSVFYFSQKEYTHHKQLLESLATEGAGRYSYIQKENAAKILVIEAQSVRKKNGQ